MTTRIDGQLQIDHERGVIYFHSATTGWTVLRICSLPTPIPDVTERQLDITHMYGVDWGPITPVESENAGRCGYALEKKIKRNM